MAWCGFAFADTDYRRRIEPQAIVAALNGS
jgi:hypothetical protein